MLDALASESGAQGVLFDEKKPRVENLVTLSLQKPGRSEIVMRFAKAFKMQEKPFLRVPITISATVLYSTVHMWGAEHKI
jgi:hypothetical protein